MGNRGRSHLGRDWLARPVFGVLYWEGYHLGEPPRDRGVVMDIFILAMRLDFEGYYGLLCSKCNIADWGHDRWKEARCNCPTQ